MQNIQPLNPKPETLTYYLGSDINPGHALQVKRHMKKLVPNPKP